MPSAAPALLVVLLLPLVLARCPCPPAPAASKLCGSDYETYDSPCHMACAAVPGLSATHPGPCSPLESAMLAAPAGRVRTDPRLHWVRSVVDDYEKLQKCYADNACKTKTCSACSSLDSYCPNKCQLNCMCDCMAMPGSALDQGAAVGACLVSRGCQRKYDSCRGACGAGDTTCTIQCFMDYRRCGCECNQGSQASSSTPASTASSTEGPGGSPAAAPRPALALTGAVAAVCALRALVAARQ